MNDSLRNGPLLPMLVLAALIHGVVILGLNFHLPKAQPHERQQTLDVILVNPHKAPAPPEQADFLANANQKGGTDIEGRGRPRAEPRQPALEKGADERRAATPSGRPRPQQKRSVAVTTQRPSRHKVTPKAHNPVPEKRRVPLDQLLASTRQEIARLTMDLERNSRYASHRPRRKAINAATKEYRYAAYLEAWRKKVERVGNLNYPEAARRRRLHGDLLLHVAVRADGTVAEVNVVRSSGYKLLDDAAVRIVRLAAPFAPFPEEIRREVDILDITRTWQFLGNNRLFASP